MGRKHSNYHPAKIFGGIVVGLLTTIPGNLTGILNKRDGFG